MLRKCCSPLFLHREGTAQKCPPHSFFDSSLSFLFSLLPFLLSFLSFFFPLIWSYPLFFLIFFFFISFLYCYFSLSLSPSFSFLMPTFFSSFKIYTKNFVYLWILCLCVHAWAGMCTWVQGAIEPRGVRGPGAGVTGKLWTVQHGCWELNFIPLGD